MSFSLTTSAKGLGMGLAEVVPGVSGGTIAFITGIYEKLIRTLRNIDSTALRMLAKGRFRELAHHIDLWFIVSLMVGMMTGLVVGVFGITFLIENHPLSVWAFFFALILASSIMVGRDISRFTWVTVLLVVIGAAVALLITSLEPSGQRTSLGFVLISGILAISALMLPGLSGSFVLLLLGMYSYIIPAMRDLLTGDLAALPIVLMFAVGAGIGVFTMSRILHWGYERYRDHVLAVLTGIMLGSLNKIWPWQEVLLTEIDRNGREVVTFSRSVSPSTFASLESNPVFGTDPELGSSILIMVATFVAIIALNLLKRERAPLPAPPEGAAPGTAPGAAPYEE
jgi:putative membrane protein